MPYSFANADGEGQTHKHQNCPIPRGRKPSFIITFTRRCDVFFIARNPEEMRTWHQCRNMLATLLRFSPPIRQSFTPGWAYYELRLPITPGGPKSPSPWGTCAYLAFQSFKVWMVMFSNARLCIACWPCSEKTPTHLLAAVWMETAWQLLPAYPGPTQLAEGTDDKGVVTKKGLKMFEASCAVFNAFVFCSSLSILFVPC